MSKSERTSNVRLHKFLAQCGVASRRKCEALIAAGKVQVNGVVITELGSTIQPGRDRIALDGVEVRVAPLVLLLLNKPRGVVSTMSDPQGRRCISDLLTPRYRHCFPIGRLDFESEGLVLITNDGALAEVMLHPRYELERVYRVKVHERIPDRALQQLERGVKLIDGPARAKVLHVEDVPDGCWVELSVREGRNRLVRRMFDKVNHPVEQLIRIAHGPFRLGSLRPGEIRKVSERDHQRHRTRLLGLMESDSSERSQSKRK